jgi:DNA polymerase-4
VHVPALQLELSMGLPDEAVRPGTAAGAARWAVDHQMDAVRTRFGRAAVGYTSTVFSAVGQVPDEFRELAEHDG